MNPSKAAEYRVIVAAGVVRLIIAAFTPLFPDETYYWDWSRHLQTGYFDHPPLVAFLIRFGTLLFGATPIGARLGPVLAGVAGTALIAAAARRLGGERAGFTAAVIFAAMPLSAAGLILATPDAGLLAATAAVVYAIVRAFEHASGSRESLKWWCVAGVAQGVAFWSKYTAILIPAALFFAILLFAAQRARLREPGPYVATAIASVVFLPVLGWNADHAWVSFTYQLQHGLTGSGGSIIQRESELIGGQLGLVSPILFVMMTQAVVAALRAPATGVTRVLSLISVVILAFFAYSATKRRVEANWPALAYIPGTIVLAVHTSTRRWDRWLNGGLMLAAALTLVIYTNSIVPILPVRAARDPAARAAGWPEMGRAVALVRDSLGASRTHVAGNRYQEASELAFQLADHPVAFSLNVDGRPNNYDLRPGFERVALKGDNLILVVDDMTGTHPAAAKLAAHFDTTRLGAPVVLARNGDPVKNLRIWVLAGWRGTWPKSPIRSAP